MASQWRQDAPANLIELAVGDDGAARSTRLARAAVLGARAAGHCRGARLRAGADAPFTHQRLIAGRLSAQSSVMGWIGASLSEKSL